MKPLFYLPLWLLITAATTPQPAPRPATGSQPTPPPVRPGDRQIIPQLPIRSPNALPGRTPPGVSPAPPDGTSPPPDGVSPPSGDSPPGTPPTPPGTTGPPRGGSRPPGLPPPQTGAPGSRPGGTPAPPPSGAKGGTGVRPVVKESSRVLPSCEEVRKNAKYGIYFEKVDVEKLVQTVSDATCKTFILPERVTGKISIIGPENGKVEVTADQFYAAFLAALDSNGLAVYSYGQFLKIVEKPKAKTTNIPLVVDSNEPYTLNEQMMTRLFKVRYVEAEQLRAVLQGMVSTGGDTLVFPPDTIIVNDLASNIHRLQRLVEQLDVRSSSDEIRVIQIRYAAAQELADKIQKLFENKNPRPGQRPPGAPAPPAPVGGVTGAPTGTPSHETAGGGPATLSQLIPDERTNKLIIVASTSAFERINSLVKEIDIPVSGAGRINVYSLENHAADEIAATLQALAQGTANRPRTTGPTGTPGAPTGLPGQLPPRPPGSSGVTAAELFSGEVKISADKSTNSLVIIASQNDYRSLVKVIEKLDIPRRQVFVEAVIMEVNLNRESDFGVSMHQEIGIKTASGTLPVLFGTKYSSGSGLPPSFGLTNLLSFGGFLAGIQGPNVPELAKLGIQIPQFGVVLHALQSSSDVNVLSTPHILTSDNEEAEITVGQNVPFQAGINPLGNLSALSGAATGTAGTGTTGALGGLGGLGGLTGGLGLGGLIAPINRQNVELKLSIKPQINDSDFIRMVISEQTEEIASTDPILGPTTSKRSAKTTVVAKDQETVVLGGMMQDRTLEGVTKTPILGDIPLIGHLFREQKHTKVKTNLLLFLTPYIIKDKSDFRRIFERKMQERQQFVELFYGQIPGYDVAIDFARKAGPIAKMGQILGREENKLENGGPGSPGERMVRPRGAAAEEYPIAPTKDGTDGASRFPRDQDLAPRPAKSDPPDRSYEPMATPPSRPPDSSFEQFEPMVTPPSKPLELKDESLRVLPQPPGGSKAP